MFKLSSASDEFVIINDDDDDDDEDDEDDDDVDVGKVELTTGTCVFVCFGKALT
jgi:hypothetical protein